MFTSQNWVPRTVQANGVITSEGWFCNCGKPAQKLKGVNQASFYICAEQDESARCGFYITQEAARPRELAAAYRQRSPSPAPLRSPLRLKSRTLLAKSTEKVRGSIAEFLSPTRMNSEQQPQAVPTSPSPLPSKKRKLSEEDNGAQKSPTESAQTTPVKTAKIAENTSARMPPAPVPRPNFGTTTTAGLLTPKTPRTGNGLNTSFDGFFSSSSTTTPGTPRTPVKNQPIDTVKEIFDLLEKDNVVLSKETSENLKAILEKSIKQARTFIKARDMTRGSLGELKEKHQKCVQDLSNSQTNYELERALLNDMRKEKQIEEVRRKGLERENDLLKEELEDLKREMMQMRGQSEYTNLDTFSEDDDDDEFHDASQ